MSRIALPVALLLAGCSESSSALPPPGCDTGFTEVDGCSSPLGQCFESEGANHVDVGTEIEWNGNPPHSGDHYPIWEDEWGVHEETVGRGYWVHNLEHGGVILLHHCPDGCDPEVEVLAQAVDERPAMRVILTPDPFLDGPRFAYVAWTWVHETDSVDLAEVLCFIDEHEGNAPEDVP